MLEGRLAMVASPTRGGQAVEARLRPVNAILGLLTPGDVNPPALLLQGFVLGGLEVPIVGPDGRVDVDIVLFHPGSSHLVLVEVKSGANIEDRPHATQV
jgi:hypothetical protein